MALAGICVALGGIGVERSLKRTGSFLICNIELAACSLFFALLYSCWQVHDRGGPPDQLSIAAFFHGLDAFVVVYLALQVAGGFLVACDEELCAGVGFALAITLPLVSPVSRHHLNVQAVLGVLLVLSGVVSSALAGERQSENDGRGFGQSLQSGDELLVDV
ncbi:hypothetical protein BDW74DRAFT_172645 [Aspergillus multicolor]|uniref:uncharacterized protein n=1 Tax=Aspergillus multicolor TaxID=41759 RepID=UPI003CCE429B